MTTMLEEMAGRLQTGGLGYYNTSETADTIFLAKRPESPVDCITLYESAGKPPEYAHRTGKVYKPNLQVMVRNVDYIVARTLLESIEAYLDKTTDLVIGTRRYVSILVEQGVIPMGNENGAFKIAQNYNVEWELNE